MNIIKFIHYEKYRFSELIIFIKNRLFFLLIISILAGYPGKHIIIFFLSINILDISVTSIIFFLASFYNTLIIINHSVVFEFLRPSYKS